MRTPDANFSFEDSVPLLMRTAWLVGCATGHYTPLGEAGTDITAHIKGNVYRVEYRMSAFTAREQLGRYLRRHCAELALREGYAFFHLAGR